MDTETQELLRQTKMAWERGYQAGKMWGRAGFVVMAVLLALVIIFN